MIVFSHLLLSRIIGAQLRKQGIMNLNIRRFAYGNIKPDISPMIRTQRHKIGESYTFVQDAMMDLANSSYDDRRGWYSYHLGIVCHYITDFFTFAHNACFSGTFRQHMNYEMRIHDRVISMHGGLRADILSLHQPQMILSIDELYAYLDRMHALYMDTPGPNVQRDLSFALIVCNTVCRSLVAISTHRELAPASGL